MVNTLLGTVCFYSYKKGWNNHSKLQSQENFVINFKVSSICFSLLLFCITQKNTGKERQIIRTLSSQYKFLGLLVRM